MSEREIPSIATILQSTEFLSVSEASAKVVRVGDFAVKYGGSVTLHEAQNAIFVAKHSNVPVPKTCGTLSEESTGRNFIIPEFAPGETLAKAWPSLTPSERHDVVEQLRQAVVDLRAIPTAGYIGSIDRQPCADGLFYAPEHPLGSLVTGPFDTQEDMNQGMLRKFESSEKRPYINFLRTLISATLHDHRTFFMHGDLQLKNIMMQRTSSTSGDPAPLKVKIIDWEVSGWYPEYWESCNATYCARFKPDWLEIVQSAMSIYPQEYLMMEEIRHMIYY
jgi:hypothetical protein